MKEVEYFDIDGNLILFENLLLLRVGMGERILNYRIDCKVNNYIVCREVSGVFIYDNEGNFIVGVVVGCDISDRLKNEENLLLKV